MLTSHRQLEINKRMDTEMYGRVKEATELEMTTVNEVP